MHKEMTKTCLREKCYKFEKKKNKIFPLKVDETVLKAVTVLCVKIRFVSIDVTEE